MDAILRRVTEHQRHSGEAVVETATHKPQIVPRTANRKQLQNADVNRNSEPQLQTAQMTQEI
jgi:hypothetical protein